MALRQAVVGDVAAAGRTARRDEPGRARACGTSLCSRTRAATSAPGTRRPSVICIANRGASLHAAPVDWPGRIGGRPVARPPAPTPLAVERARGADARPADAFEVIVVHDYQGDDAEVLDGHPLARVGADAPNSGGAGNRAPVDAAQSRLARGAALRWWRSSTTTAGRRPTGSSAWCGDRRARTPARSCRAPLAPIRTRSALRASPHIRTLHVEPPHDYAQTCNIAYPVALLERMDGFDEDFPAPAGEDTDLAQRALSAGAELVGAPDALVYHGDRGVHAPVGDQAQLEVAPPGLRREAATRACASTSGSGSSGAGGAPQVLLLIAGCRAIAPWFWPALVLALPVGLPACDTPRGGHKRGLSSSRHRSNSPAGWS